jgi:hypothetical protein
MVQGMGNAKHDSHAAAITLREHVFVDRDVAMHPSAERCL